MTNTPVNDDSMLEREADVMGPGPLVNGNVSPTTETVPEPAGESEGEDDSVYVL